MEKKYSCSAEGLLLPGISCSRGKGSQELRAAPAQGYLTHRIPQDLDSAFPDVLRDPSTGSKAHPQVQKGMEPGRSELQQRPEVAPEEAWPLQSSGRKEGSEPVLKSIPYFEVWGSVQRRRSRVSQP